MQKRPRKKRKSKHGLSPEQRIVWSCPEKVAKHVLATQRLMILGGHDVNLRRRALDFAKVELGIRIRLKLLCHHGGGRHICAIFELVLRIVPAGNLTVQRQFRLCDSTLPLLERLCTEHVQSHRGLLSH